MVGPMPVRSTSRGCWWVWVPACLPAYRALHDGSSGPGPGRRLLCIQTHRTPDAAAPPEPPQPAIPPVPLPPHGQRLDGLAYALVVALLSSSRTYIFRCCSLCTSGKRWPQPQGQATVRWPHSSSSCCRRRDSGTAVCLSHPTHPPHPHRTPHPRQLSIKTLPACALVIRSLWIWKAVCLVVSLAGLLVSLPGSAGSRRAGASSAAPPAASAAS